MLSEYEESMFEELSEADELGVIDALLDGQRVSVVVVDMGDDEDDGPVPPGVERTLPVAILLTEEMFRRLSPPSSMEVDDNGTPGMSSSSPPG